MQAVISDKKVPVPDTQDPTIVAFYNPGIIAATDYYPFGMVITNRSVDTEKYRYGYQAQLTDQELWDGAVSYKYRIEDPRIGRFFSVDPLAPEYPWNSPYAFSENRVIDGVELEGLEYKAKYDESGTIIGADFLGYDDQGCPLPNTVGFVAWAEKVCVDGEIRECLTFTDCDQGYGTSTIVANEYGVVHVPEKGIGFDRYSRNANNETYIMGMYREKTDNWADADAAAAFMNLAYEFNYTTGMKIHYGDISAKDPRINLKHATHYLGRSFDLHYINAKGEEVVGLGTTSYLYANKENMNKFLALTKKWGFTNNYSYGVDGLVNIKNPNEGQHMDHFHIGFRGSEDIKKRLPGYVKYDISIDDIIKLLYK